METLVRLLQPSKHPLDHLTDDGIATLVTPEQETKHQSPSDVTDEGIVMLVRPEQ